MARPKLMVEGKEFPKHLTTIEQTRHTTVFHNTRQGVRIMAKKSGVNKSQAIRDHFKANPKAKAQEVVDALAKKGIKTTTNYVSNLKASHNKRRRAMKKVVAKGGIGIPEVKAALAFIKATGSVAAAKQALAVAKEIREIV